MTECVHRFEARHEHVFSPRVDYSYLIEEGFTIKNKHKEQRYIGEACVHCGLFVPKEREID